MTEREFLQQVFNAYQDVDCKLEQIARLQALATRTTTTMCGTPCGNGTKLSSKIEQAVLAVSWQSERLADGIKRLLDTRIEVADAIAKVANHSERRILEYRYLAFLPWKEIAHMMKIGVRQVYKLHTRALKNFSAQFTKVH